MPLPTTGFITRSVINPSSLVPSPEWPKPLSHPQHREQHRMKSSPTLYLAVRETRSPNGWVSSSGLLYKPEWGDRLVEVDGQMFIQVNEILPGS